MIQNLCQLTYKEHHVHISRDLSTGQLLLFKHNEHRCLWESFTRNQWDEAADFVLDPMPLGTWQFEPDCPSE